MHSHKKEDEILPFATAWMDQGYLSETEEDKYHMILFIHAILKKIKSNKNKPTNTKTKKWLSEGKGQRER